MVPLVSVLSGANIVLFDELSKSIDNNLEIHLKNNLPHEYCSTALKCDTYGSHVTLINYPNFDNLYRSYPDEFFYNRIPAPLAVSW